MMVSNAVMSTKIINIIGTHQSKLAKHMQHISQGMRVSCVADDPSGWAIGQRMDVRLRGIDQACRNAQFSKSMLKVAEGGISSTVDLLRELKAKAIEAASDTCTDNDRRTIQKLFDQFGDQIDDNASITFNGKILLDGSLNTPALDTAQVMTNQSLATNTTASSILTDLNRRDGSSLNILATDTLNLSYIRNGTTYYGSYTAGNTTIADMLSQFNQIEDTIFAADSLQDTSLVGIDAAGNSLHTTDNENAISFTAAATGLAGAIAGLTISVTDTDGQIKKAATTALNNFTESIAPRDKQSSGLFYTAATPDASQSMTSFLGDMRSYSLGIKGQQGETLDVSTQKGANAALSALDRALERALDQQTTIGSMSMRMDYTISNLTTESETLTAAMSTILDADMAKEMTEFAKENILLQAAQAMLAQNNHQAGWFLSLLQG